jgi:hypothetical protein
VAPYVSNTLDDIPYKWYKIEEAWGETFSWITLKENFIKYFEFRIEEAQLVQAVQELRYFIEKPNPEEVGKRGKVQVDMGLTSTCNFVLSHQPVNQISSSTRHGECKFS